MLLHPHAQRGATAVLCFSPHQGGMELDACHTAERLNQHLTTTWLLVRAGTFLETYARARQVPVIALDFKYHFSLRAIAQMRRLWRRLGIRNLIFFGASELRSIHFSLDQHTPVQRLIVRHSTTKSSSKRDLWHAYLYSKVSAHWCISQHLANNVRQIFPIPAKVPVFVAPSALAEHLVKIPTALPLQKAQVFKVLFIGRLIEGKGIFDALAAVSLLKARGVPVELTYIGAGLDEVALQQEAAVSGVKVHLLGYQKEAHLAFAQHHAFIFPSYGEGFGNSFVEALSSGMPCVCYQNTVFPELAAYGLHFRMATDRHIEELAQHLAYFWQMRPAINQKNQRLSRELFSLQQELEALKQHLV